MKFVCIRVLACVVSLAVAGLGWNSPAWATVSTWTATGAGPFNWTGATNWSTNPTVPNAASDTANFSTVGGPAAQTVNLGAAITLGTLDLTNTATSYTIANGAGGSFNFDNGGSQAKITSNAGSLSQTVSADIAIGSTGLTVEQFGANTLTLSGPINTNGVPLIVNSGIASGTAGNVVISGVIDGFGSFVKHNTQAVAGTVTLTAANTYSGETFFGADGTGALGTSFPLGTITLSGGNNRLPAGSVLNLFPQNFVLGSSYSGTLDIGSTSQTLSTIRMPGATLAANRVDAQATGSIFSINGTDGTLTLNGDDLIVGITHISGGTLTSALHRHNLNMNGLTNFIFDNPTKSIVVHDSGFRVSSITYLAGILSLGNKSTVNAQSVLVGDTGPNGVAGGGRSDLQLGLTSTTLNIGSNATDGVINVGYSGRSTANLILPTGASVTIRGFGGGSAPLPKFLVGLGQNSNSANVFTDTVNFSAGTTNAIVTQLDLSTAFNSGSRGGGTIGNFLLGATSGPEGFTVENLKIGIITGTGTALVANMSSAGTFTINNANGVLNAGTISIGENTILELDAFGDPMPSSLTKTVTGKLALLDGTVRATAIQSGPTTVTVPAGTFNGTATAPAGALMRSIEWTTGTLENKAGSDLAINSVPIVLLTTATHTFNATGSNTITQAADAPISGATFGITKTGTGGLVLNAANTYTGSTTVNGGSLTVSGAAATIGAGNVTVSAGSAAIAAGVANAIADAATLTLLGGGTAGIADTGFINLGAGINETINSLVLGATVQGIGTYGSSLSSATFKLDEYFSGTGILTILSGPAGVPGDYNNNGVVDAADYVVWRKANGTNTQLQNEVANTTPGSVTNDDYLAWRSRFGNTSGSGGGLGGAAGVPEPAVFGLLFTALLGALSSRRVGTRRE
jgi:autotransporter-associated beta strand protein